MEELRFEDFYFEGEGDEEKTLLRFFEIDKFLINTEDSEDEFEETLPCKSHETPQGTKTDGQPPPTDLILNFTYLPPGLSPLDIPNDDNPPTEEPPGRVLFTPDPLLPYPTDDIDTEVKHEDVEDELPVVLASEAGLLKIILQNDVSVEVTLDRAIRLTNSKHQSAIAVNNTGTVCCLVENSSIALQDLNSVEIKTDVNRFVKMDPQSMIFGSDGHSYRIRNNQLSLAPSYISDLSHDVSVNVLFSSSQFGPHLDGMCQTLANAASIEITEANTVVWVNGVRVRQANDGGDVVVTSESKYLRVSPHRGCMTIGTRDVNMKSNGRGTLRVFQRNDYIQVKPNSLLVSNRRIEGGFDEQRKVFVRPTPPRYASNGGHMRRQRQIRTRSFSSSDFGRHLYEVNRSYEHSFDRRYQPLRYY